jgi:hypothetical protein
MREPGHALFDDDQAAPLERDQRLAVDEPPEYRPRERVPDGQVLEGVTLRGRELGHSGGE